MKEPFRPYILEKDKKKDDITFTVRITPEDQKWFLPAKIFIKQPKASTALKQLAQIGATNVLHDKKINDILDILKNNIRRNERMGIPEREIKKIKK